MRIVHALALDCWREVVYEPLRPRLIREVLGEIEADRRGEASNVHVVQATVLSMVKMAEYEEDPLAIYVEAFEIPFLKVPK